MGQKFRSALAMLALSMTAAASAALAQAPKPAEEALAQVARQLFELRPVPLKLDLPPFRTFDNGLGDCDEELRDRLIEALKVEQADPVNSIVERRIDIRQPRALSDDSDAIARISGRYGADTQGRVWVEARVIARDRTVLAALPRSLVTGLVCRGVQRTLPDSVEYAIRAVRQQGLGVRLTRPNPRVGDLVSIAIESDGPQADRVLCLNIAGSNTAQVLTPLRTGTPRLSPRGMLTWPRDFEATGGPTGPICFDREQNDSLVCVGLPSQPPAALLQRWRAAWPVGALEPTELSAEAAMELVGEAIAAPGAVVGFQRYQVRRGPSGGISACGTALPR